MNRKREKFAGEYVEDIVSQNQALIPENRWAIWRDFQAGKVLVCLYVIRGDKTLRFAGIGNDVSAAFAKASVGLN